MSSPGRHAIPLVEHSLERSPNLVLIGDTVASIEPVWGEGIHFCLGSGRLAALATTRALLQDDTARLHDYERLWKQQIGHDRANRIRVADALYSLDDATIDRFVSVLDGIGEMELHHLKNGRKRELLRLTASNPRLLYEIARDIAF